MKLTETQAYSLERFIQLYELQESEPAHVWDGEKYQEKLVTCRFIDAIKERKNWYQSERIIELCFHQDYANLKCFSDNLKYLVDKLTQNKEVICFSCYLSGIVEIKILLSEDAIFTIKELLKIPHGQLYENDYDDEDAIRVLKLLVGDKSRYTNVWFLENACNKASKGILNEKDKEKLITNINKLKKTYQDREFEYRVHLLLPYGYRTTAYATNLYHLDRITDIFKVKDRIFVWTDNKTKKEA